MRPRTSHSPLGLDIVLVGNLGQEGDGSAGPLLILVGSFDRLVGHMTILPWVVGVGAVVAVHCHSTVSLVRVKGSERCVDRNLLVVNTQSVAMGIWVREETRLEDWVGRRFNTRYQVRC